MRDHVSEDARAHVRRRLAAILVAGYGPLSPTSQADSFAAARAVLAEAIEPLVREFSGNVFKRTGDLALAEFDSVVEAVRCAAALRDAIGRRNQAAAEERRIALRIGVNLGDVIIEAGDFFGDGVNIAARIEALAQPGSVYVSETAYQHVADKTDFDFEDLGPQTLKNIKRPIRVYQMGGETKPKPLDFGADPAVAAVPSGFDDRRALAVLPFANFSDDPEQEFFADGITEDIISLLAGWRAFPVIARNSTFTYKGRQADIKKVGEELGARYVVEGSVRKSGRRVRVTAQLIQADSGHHIMAERYDRDLTDLFELQDEITSAIAGAIQPELLKSERERIAEQPQPNENAYEFYQRAMWHHYRQNKTDNQEAQAYFRRALALDARYPQAAAGLSIALTSAALTGWADNRDIVFEEAYDLAQRSISLDQRYPNAHFALGLACMWTRRTDRGIAAFEDAIKFNPSFAAAYVLLGQMFLYTGRPEGAVEQAQKGIRLSPSDPRMFIWLLALAGAHYQMRHYQEAIEAGRRSWSLNRNWPAGLRYVAAGLAQLGRIEEAQAPLLELRQLNTDLAFVEANFRRLYVDDAAVDHLLDGLRKAGMS